jgi:hypothetical protein
MAPLIWTWMILNSKLLLGTAEGPLPQTRTELMMNWFGRLDDLLVQSHCTQLTSFQVIDSHITPAIFRLVCKHFNDPSDAVSFEEYCQDADKWIDCWVGCANVLVQLGKRVCCAITTVSFRN